MKKAARPTKTRILGKDIVINYETEGELAFTNYGISVPGKLKIVIQNGLPLALEQEIVMHEQMHMGSIAMGAELTEHQVTTMACWLIQLFRDNPEQLDYFKRVD
jgi:hypothetical protein